jgi:hypothetical protein
VEAAVAYYGEHRGEIDKEIGRQVLTAHLSGHQIMINGQLGDALPWCVTPLRAGPVSADRCDLTSYRAAVSPNSRMLDYG